MWWGASHRPRQSPYSQGNVSVLGTTYQRTRDMVPCSCAHSSTWPHKMVYVAGGSKRSAPNGTDNASPHPPARTTATAILQDVFPKILILDDFEQALAHRGRVEHDVLRRILGQLEHHFLEQGRHHGMQATRADVLHPLVDLGRDARDLAHAVGRKLERRAVGLAQRRVLLGQRVL